MNRAIEWSATTVAACLALTWLGLAVAPAGEAGAATRTISMSAADAFERMGDKNLLSIAYLAYALIETAKEEWARADAWFEKSAAILDDAGMPADRGWVYLEWSLSCIERGDEAAARQHLQTALASYGEAGIEYRVESIEKMLAEIECTEAK